jgi:hypothetical protein
MKGPSWGLVHGARCAGTTDFYPAFAALVSPVQNIIFLTAYFFHFISPHRPATWAGSRAGSPVSGSLSATTPAVNSRLSERHRGYTMTNNISNNVGT